MPIVKLPGGSLRDEIRETVYDTIDFVTASPPVNSTQSFFSAVQGKPISQTNLRQNNLLETAVSFRTQGLALDVLNFTDANAVAIPLVQENSGVRFRVGEKIYLESPMRFAAGRVWTDVAGGTSRIYQQHGAAAVAGIILTGHHVVDINPLQSFQVDWLIEGLTAAELALLAIAADTKLRYVCSLKGIKRRPVQ